MSHLMKLELFSTKKSLNSSILLMLLAILEGITLKLSLSNHFLENEFNDHSALLIRPSRVDRFFLK